MTGKASDKGSLWILKESSTTSEVCELGTPIKCGDVVRLEHVDTGKNLHSHLFRAPLSGNQEVSGYGENGEGDTGDNWQITCTKPGAIYWDRGAPITLLHQDTKKYLMTSQTFVFNRYVYPLYTYLPSIGDPIHTPSIYLYTLYRGSHSYTLYSTSYTLTPSPPSPLHPSSFE